MKKSNVILGAFVLIVLLFGLLYLMPVRESLCPTDSTKCKRTDENCLLCKKTTTKSVKQVSSKKTVTDTKPKKK
jgi:hypothetical protein